MGISVAKAAPNDVVARCDALASDPHDPGRYATGVTDEQFAPGAAIEACQAAVDASPSLPRTWFQLGRAYWIAERDADAFAAFVKAERLGYAPAMKYIGDAYKQGRGLPAGEQQSLNVAMEWYKKAQAAGYRQAAIDIQNLSADIASSTFNPSLFQNPTYMTLIYNGNFESVDNPITFFAYTRSFTDELGGTNVFFINQDCKGMITALGSAVNHLGELFGYLQAFQGGNDAFAHLLGSALGSAITQNQGERDADILMNKYKCDNPITRRIVDNMVGSYQKLPTIINAFKDKNSTPGYSSTHAGVPLYQERVTPLYWGVIAGKCAVRPVAGCNRVQQLVSSRDYDVIQCNYGPINSNGTGYQNYAFWHSKVPDNPLGYAIQGDDHPFLMLGKLPVAKCPPTAGEAEPIFQASRLSQ